MSMKKLLIFFIVALLLTLTSYSFVCDYNIFSLFNVTSVQVYTSEKNDDDRFSHIQNGCGEIYFCNSENFEEIMSSLNYISGYTLKIEKSHYCLSDVAKMLNIKVSTQKDANLYGFSQNFPFKVKIGGKEVSVQVLEQNDCFLIGSPILLGSY